MKPHDAQVNRQEMMKIKLFSLLTPHLERIEDQVNDFLSENEGKITVKDIKFTSTVPNPNNSVWKNWSVMVIYEPV